MSLPGFLAYIDPGSSALLWQALLAAICAGCIAFRDRFVGLFR